MPYEVEQKFHIDAAQPVKDALARMGSPFGDAIAQTDTYFAHPARDFAATDEALRLRRQGEATFVTYKGPKVDAVTKTRLEMELPLPDGEEYATRFQDLLVVLGFRVAAQVRKRRRTARVAWEGSNIEVSLDEVENLGNFAELEAQAEEADVSQARERVASLAGDLGLTRNERSSYLELISR